MRCNSYDPFPFLLAPLPCECRASEAGEPAALARSTDTLLHKELTCAAQRHNPFGLAITPGPRIFTMAGIPPELAAVLASINARLGAIEAAISSDGAGSGAAAGESLCRIANDFDASVVKGAGAKAVETALALGDEGKKLVRPSRLLVLRAPPCGPPEPPASCSPRLSPPPPLFTPFFCAG